MKRLRHFLIYRIGVPLLNALDALIARYSACGNPAVFDHRHFPWAAELEANWEVIREELEEILRQRLSFPGMETITSDLSHMTNDQAWKTFFLYGYGYKIEPNCARCPETTRILESIPDMKTGLFSFLLPGKHIPRHRGEYKGLIRCHLGLIIPLKKEQCRMAIDDELVVWEEGRLVIFDNSYHHEVWNDTDQLRVILMFDVVRPMRWPWNWINRAIIRIITWSPYVQAARRKQEAWNREEKAKASEPVPV